MACDNNYAITTNKRFWRAVDPRKAFYSRLGLSFIRPIESLIANSGLEEILKPTIAAVEKMRIGKKYPMNLRALRIVVEELL